MSTDDPSDTTETETVAGEDSAGDVTVGEYGWVDFAASVDLPDNKTPEAVLGFAPDHIETHIAAGATRARLLRRHSLSLSAPDTGLKTEPDEVAAKSVVETSRSEETQTDSEITRLREAARTAETLAGLANRRSVTMRDDVDSDEFFTTSEGAQTVVTRYDVEKAVPMAKKPDFVEEHRYWVNKPFACVFIFKSTKENEYKYYAVEPYLTDIETEVRDSLTGKIKQKIKYVSDEVGVDGGTEERADVIQRETLELLDRYNIYDTAAYSSQSRGIVSRLKGLLPGGSGPVDSESGSTDELAGIAARPEPAVRADASTGFSEYQVEKLLYFLKRDFTGYGRIDPIKYDINVEDISCDGYNTRVFVYHSDHEQIISNIQHGKEELDNFVVKLAQRSGMGISKRQPQVDATLPDGSRAQLTLGTEVSDHGTNYTIRQFNDVPFTPVDLINWNTFDLDEMAFLWLCIENHKALIFAGGTASGKTTSLNAVSLFIPSNAKIVSIEDTREVELPQRNWVASVTRPSFGQEDVGQIDEFDLLEAALRQRPDYIVMGEVRGEEGRTLFQVMSTGHTTYTTFHADSVGEVIKRFTTDPINVSKTLFTALDLVSIQTQTRVDGHKVRRNKVLTEINEYTPENDEINVRDVYEWRAETDEFIRIGQSSTLEQIKFDRGWTQRRVNMELFERKIVLAYLIREGINTYTQVAATVQAYINDPDAILRRIADDTLEESLESLREMESVRIDVDKSKEEAIPRPDPPAELLSEVEEVLSRGKDTDVITANAATDEPAQQSEETSPSPLGDRSVDLDATETGEQS